jgi:hypothetical protein
MEPWDFIKTSVLYLLRHMELILRLSFYLRRCLGGYTLGTTMGFPVEMVGTCSTQGSRATAGVIYPRYHGPLVTAQKSLIQLILSSGK